MPMQLLKRMFMPVLAGLVVSAAGCATEGSGAASGFFADAGITTRVKKAIYDDPSLKVTAIGVTTQNGVVQLTGSVKSRGESMRVVRVVRKVEGVKGVKNDLQVKR
jgi:osmotically-inducible protein OsmY